MTRTNIDRLARRFVRALEAVGATASGERVFAELVERHAEPHRHYHTFEHVDACLGWLDWVAAHGERPAEVALALFFHDAMYDPRASDNEARSAQLARERLEALGAPPEAVARIEAFILATATHEAEHGDPRLVVDLDLTILGARPAVYDAFEEQIRSEYAHVPEPLFRAGRRQVLEHFLERETLYAVPPLQDELEKRARANLERRIGELH